MGARERIRAFVLKNMSVYDREKSSFKDDDDLFQRGFITSLVALKLVTFVEKEFGIAVSNEDLDVQTFSTVDNIVRLVDRKLASTSRA